MSVKGTYKLLLVL